MAGLAGLTLAARTRCCGLTLFALLGFAQACTSTEDDLEPEPIASVARPHDARAFAIDRDGLAFDASPGVASDRFWGVLERAAYRVEIPAAWNGMLVMYAHGHRREPMLLTVSTPALRPHLLDLGYAWAASSYSANHYDVRAGIEDTNALALAFSALAAEHGRVVSDPTAIYIVGSSMGGHVAVAAVERETLATARHVKRYDGALALCGTVADAELVHYYTAYALGVFELAGRSARSFPIPNYAAELPSVIDALWQHYPDQVSDAGSALYGLLMNLSGGPRPGYALGFSSWQDRLLALGAGNDDLSAGDLNGVLARNIADTTQIRYRLGEVAAPGRDDSFNARVLRVAPDPHANPARADGLRWLPPVAGAFDVPVVTLHDLGDLYVPLRMGQIYAARARAQGSADHLVQRAIRAVDHCDFTLEEQAAAFDALTAWHQHGLRPAGDDLLDAAALADPDYGCRLTIDPDPLPPTRAALPRCP